jgi:hypothetical protein
VQFLDKEIVKYGGVFLPPGVSLTEKFNPWHWPLKIVERNLDDTEPLK